MKIMPATSISIYLTNEEYPIYLENQELLHQKAREAFEKELDRIRKSVEKSIPGELEDEQDESVHKRVLENKEKKASDRLYKVDERHNKKVVK
jgi:hypothetical protein